MLKSFCLFVILLFNITLLGQSLCGDFDTNQLNYIYNNGEFELDSIDSSVRELCLIEAYHFFWKGLIESNSFFVDVADSLLIAHDALLGYHEHCKIRKELLQMRIDLSRGHYFSLLRHQNELRSYFSAQMNEKDDFDVLFYGMYHYFASAIREQNILYKLFMKDWPPSDKVYGRNLILKSLHSSSELVIVESCYFMGRIYLEVEDNPTEAKLLFTRLNTYFPNNTVFKDFLVTAKNSLL